MIGILFSLGGRQPLRPRTRCGYLRVPRILSKRLIYISGLLVGLLCIWHAPSFGRAERPRRFFIQKKIRTRDTPLCSTYYVEYSIRITPRGADQCLIQTAWAPVWLAYVGPFQKTITKQIKKGILFNSNENLHLIASKVAHWNVQKQKT